MGGTGFAPRVGVIGPRRRRQGLGPFLVRDLLRAGARVPCVLSTSAETAEAARRDLASATGAAPESYLDLDEMIAREDLHALAILSPAETHERYLGAALAAGLHVLCEKPFVWAGDGLAARARRLCSDFESAGLLLRENCQWPYTLPAFARLHPGTLDGPPRRFEMSMQPANPGIGRLGDSLPHPLSLLQALAPRPGRVEAVEVSGTPEGAEALEIRFAHRTGSSRTDARIELRRSDAFPRRVSFAVDGRCARRVVGEGYRISFADGERSVPVEDPLTQLIAEFVRDVPEPGHAPTASRSEEIVERMEMLEAIVGAYRRAEAKGT